MLLPVPLQSIFLRVLFTALNFNTGRVDTHRRLIRHGTHYGIPGNGNGHANLTTLRSLKPIKSKKALFHRGDAGFLDAYFSHWPASNKDYAITVHSVYSWTRDLPPNLELPEGELLEDVHAYVADFFAVHKKPSGADSGNSNKKPRNRVALPAPADMRTDISNDIPSETSLSQSNIFRSLDETALVALGVLLEESMREALGDQGDFALVEADGEEQGALPMLWNGWEMVDLHLGSDPERPEKKKKKR
jgi:hypothetical protein